MSFRDQISSQRAAARSEAEEALASDGARGESLFTKFKSAASRKSDRAQKPAKPAKRVKLSTKTRSGRTPLAAHKSFVPLIVGWGAALCGLIIAILPEPVLRSLVGMAQLTALGGHSRLVLALLAALFGGLLAFAAARAVANALVSPAREQHKTEAETEEVRVIDPTLDLGSDSLDAPLELTGEAEPVIEDNAPVEEQRAETAIFGSLSNGLDPRMPANAEPEPLELSEVADVISYDEASFEADPVAKPAPPPPPPIPADAPDFLRGSAVESLRSMSTDNMSLIQMVERFATALHAHQAAVGETGQPRRDAALAEALRALSLFTENKEEAEAIAKRDAASLTPGGFTGKAQETERELRDALAKLQKLSGAA